MIFDKQDEKFAFLTTPSGGFSAYGNDKRRDWVFERKVDRFRCLVRKYGEQVDLIGREGKFFNASFPEIVKAVAAVPGDLVWDAELAIDSGRGAIEFASLQQRAHTISPRKIPAAARNCPARIYVFDMLASGKRDL